MHNKLREIYQAKLEEIETITVDKLPERNVPLLKFSARIVRELVSRAPASQRPRWLYPYRGLRTATAVPKCVNRSGRVPRYS